MEYNYWIFSAKGSIEKMREVIKSGRWSFVNRKEKCLKSVNHRYKLKTGDFVLFYLPDSYADGRSIIATARLGSPYLEKAVYTERKDRKGAASKKITKGKPKKINLNCGVFLFESKVDFIKEIDPIGYGIGSEGRIIFEITKEQYDSIVNVKR